MESLLFPFEADAQPLWQGQPRNDSRECCSQTGDCQVNGNDVKASQVNMEVSCRPREEAQKEGMYEINGIRVVAQKGEEPMQERRYAVTFEPIEKVEYRRQGVGHADRAQLMDRKDGR